MKEKKIKSILAWLITGTICLLTVGGLGSFKWSEIQAGIATFHAQPEFSETVEIATIERKEFTQFIKTIGVAVAPQQVVLRNELPGQIVEINFKSGSTVEKGDVILQIDISEERANLASQKARAKLAESVYNREADLRKSNAVSQEALDRARAELDIVRAEIDAITSVIRKKTVIAPFTGTIGIHQLEVGQFLDANYAITTLIGKSEHTWVDFNLPQFYGDVPIDTSVEIRVVRAHESGGTIPGAIIAGDTAISTGSRSRLYRARVEEVLRHNASVEVNIPVKRHDSLVKVVAEAIQRDSQSSFVWILDPEKNEGTYRAKRVNVSIEGQHGSQVFVSGELTDGQVVACNGAFKIFEGLLVHGLDRQTDTLARKRESAGDL